MSEIVKIFDTTLRDGELKALELQMKLTKVIIAKQLEKLRVDIIEAGFAAASAGDYAAYQRSLKYKKQHYARCFEPFQGYKSSWRSGIIRSKNRIHTFIATSPIHMEKT